MQRIRSKAKLTSSSSFLSPLLLLFLLPQSLDQNRLRGLEQHHQNCDGISSTRPLLYLSLTIHGVGGGEEHMELDTWNWAASFLLATSVAPFEGWMGQLW